MSEEYLEKLLELLVEEQKKTNTLLESIRDEYLQDVVYNTGGHN